MHIDHDHIAGGEHSHEHTHSHTHEHTHDGHTHTHEHTHEHTHSHEHPHDHDHLHESGSAHNHAHTPMDELLALMKYMVGHNASHAKELADLAAQLKSAAGEAAYEKVMSAVADFDKGNKKISQVLKELGAE
ncbi:MAG: cobalt transporter [Faecousia sp.]